MAIPKKGQVFDYVIYKGDNVVCHGTKQECAEYLNVKESTVAFMATKAYQNRSKGNGLVAVKVEVSELVV